MRTSFSKPLRHSGLLAAFTALFAAACGSSGGATGGAGGTGTGGSGTTSSSSSSGSSSSSSGTGATGGTAPTCPGMGYSGSEINANGGSVTATIVDQNGAPVADQPVYICGTNICSDPGKTGADGKVTISTNLMMKRPAFKFGDAVAYSEFAVLLTQASTDVGTVGTAKLPATGAAMLPGMDATSGGVTISVAAGASVAVNELIYDTPEKQQLRAVELPLAQEGPALDAAQGFEQVFGVAPAGTLLCPAAKVTVPNTKGWAAATQVEFWVMTVDTGQEYAPYAGWAKASDGEVSADGKTVSTLDSGGFIYLDNFALRKKP